MSCCCYNYDCCKKCCCSCCLPCWKYTGWPIFKTKILYPFIAATHFALIAYKIHIAIFLIIFVGSSPLTFVANALYMDSGAAAGWGRFIINCVMTMFICRMAIFLFNNIKISLQRLGLLKAYFLTNRDDYYASSYYINLPRFLKKRVIYGIVATSCTNKWMFVLIECLHPLVSLGVLICIVILPAYGSAKSKIEKGEDVSIMSYVGQAALYAGSLALLLYWFVSIIFDYINRFVKQWSDLETSEKVWTFILTFVPGATLLRYVHIFFKWLKMKLQISDSKCSIIMSVACYLLIAILIGFTIVHIVMFDIFRIKLAKQGYDSGRNPIIYVLLPYLSFIPGLDEPIHYLKTCKRYHHIEEEDAVFEKSSNGIELKDENNQAGDEPSDSKPITGERIILKHIFGNNYHSGSIFVILLFVAYIFVQIKFASWVSDIKKDSDYFSGVNTNTSTPSTKADFLNYDYSQLKMDNATEIMSETHLLNSHMCKRDGYGNKLIEYYCASKLSYDDQFNATDDKNIYGYFYCHEYMSKKGWGLCVERQDSNVHFAILNKTINGEEVDILSYRGTTESYDWFQDIHLFVDTVVVPLSVLNLPFYTNDCLKDLVYLYSFFGASAFPKGTLYMAKRAGDVYDTLSGRKLPKESRPKRTIITSGHSLGGALANIVAARNEVDSFTVSPPGIFLQQRIFQFTKESADYHLRSVIPEADPVPNLGVNDGGQIYNIPCFEKGMLACHTLDNSICMAAAMCHDVEFTCMCHNKWKQWKINCENWSTNCTSSKKHCYANGYRTENLTVNPIPKCSETILKKQNATESQTSSGTPSISILMIVMILFFILI